MCMDTGGRGFVKLAAIITLEVGLGQTHRHNSVTPTAFPTLPGSIQPISILPGFDGASFSLGKNPSRGGGLISSRRKTARIVKPEAPEETETASEVVAVQLEAMAREGVWKMLMTALGDEVDTQTCRGRREHGAASVATATDPHLAT